MNTPISPKIFVIGGPTASGKTAFAIELAEKLNTEIISVDSRQVYRELNIGVAKPSENELLLIKHHGISTVGIQEHYNAGAHAKIFQPILNQLLQNKGSAVICGGTGLYIEALLYGMDDLPEVDVDLRSEILDHYVAHGLPPLVEMLLKLDHNAAAYVQLNNPNRVTRAIELCIQIKKPLAEIFRQKSKSHFGDFDILHIGIEHDRAILYERINKRVNQMIEAGMPEEVKALLPFRDLKALQTVGYSELFDYFDEKCNLEFAIDKIKQHTRNYSKRQITFFSNRFKTQWIPYAKCREFLCNFAHQI